MKKIIPFIIPSKRIKYWGITKPRKAEVVKHLLRIRKTKKQKTLTKEVKYLHTEYYKILVKEIKADTLCSWIGKINIVKIYITYRVIYRFNIILLKAQWLYYSNREWSPTIYMEPQKTTNSKNNYKKITKPDVWHSWF
jgi:hypothetical protein